MNAISNGGAREKVGELYKRNYLILLYTYKFGNIPSRTKVQIVILSEIIGKQDKLLHSKAVTYQNATRNKCDQRDAFRFCPSPQHRF